MMIHYNAALCRPRPYPLIRQKHGTNATISTHYKTNSLKINKKRKPLY